MSDRPTDKYERTDRDVINQCKIDRQTDRPTDKYKMTERDVIKRC